MLTLAFSPCPNDTYIFDAMVHHKVDTEGLEFEYHLDDVEQLNQAAAKRIPDITKLSFNAFLHLADDYLLLDSGAALGFGTGPLLISKQKIHDAYLADKLVAVPGKNTTANFLFTLAFPEHTRKEEALFSDIEQGILDGKYDAGVIIHESRFTYQSKGLQLVTDLGLYWELLTRCPVPLGGIVAHKRLGKETIEKVNRIIRRSVQYANSNTHEPNEFICCHAVEMNPEVMKQHIKLYVNEYSVSLGSIGRNAVETMFEKALQLGFINKKPSNIFASDFYM